MQDTVREIFILRININYPEFRRYHYKNHFYNLRAAWWPSAEASGRASDSGARGRGSILTQVTVLCP